MIYLHDWVASKILNILAWLIFIAKFSDCEHYIYSGRVVYTKCEINSDTPLLTLQSARISPYSNQRRSSLPILLFSLADPTSPLQIFANRFASDRPVAQVHKYKCMSFFCISAFRFPRRASELYKIPSPPAPGRASST